VSISVHYLLICADTDTNISPVKIVRDADYARIESMYFAPMPCACVLKFSSPAFCSAAFLTTSEISFLAFLVSENYRALSCTRIFTFFL